MFLGMVAYLCKFLQVKLDNHPGYLSLVIRDILKWTPIKAGLFKCPLAWQAQRRAAYI
jgi:hypothetical protein